MATPIPRPTYIRSDTDQVDHELPADHELPKKKTADATLTELHSSGSEGAFSASDDKKIPYYDGSGSDSERDATNEHFENLVLDDSEIHYSKPVENAMDLVTEVLHVDDDTSLNPWTFRMWFLGTFLSFPTVMIRSMLNYVLQALASLYLVVYYQPYTISNLRPSLFPLSSSP